ncbi:hypothetical protein HPB47_014160 [Ixodes persulcatus]|uniref:Uncharacterized protein n=1 Tax=Ixodes persulcatus TaxID=34615 RepID=A0AC60QYK0_IXOPE|nr:hypothetical protein HPB47_014160 [Ixodes persulcatus]
MLHTQSSVVRGRPTFEGRPIDAPFATTVVKRTTSTDDAPTASWAYEGLRPTTLDHVLESDLGTSRTTSAARVPESSPRRALDSGRPPPPKWVRGTGSEFSCRRTRHWPGCNAAPARRAVAGGMRPETIAALAERPNNASAGRLGVSEAKRQPADPQRTCPASMPQSRRRGPRAGGRACAKALASVLASLSAGLLLLLLGGQAPLKPRDDNNLWTGPPRWVVLQDNVTVHRGSAYNPHNFSYLLDNAELCDPAAPPKLVVLVASDSRTGAERRQAIRDTWGQRILQEALSFRIVFLLANPGNQTSAQSLLAESYAYGDLVQEDFPESFEHLALKSVMGLKWVVTRCPGADFALKTDDDILVHVPNLLAALEEASPLGDAILCRSNPVRRILRRDEGPLPLRHLKYCVSRDVLPGELFPHYCGGFAYAFTLSAARRLYEATLATPVFFIEDAYVTGFCRLKAGLRTLGHPGISLIPRVSPARASCAFGREGRITSHELGPSDMQALWKEINTQGFFCPRVVGVIAPAAKPRRY